MKKQTPYEDILNEDDECPLPLCDFSGSRRAVHSHIHGCIDDRHEWVAKNSPNAFYPPKDELQKKSFERAEAKRMAEQKFGW